MKVGIEIEGVSPLSQPELVNMFNRADIPARLHGRNMSSQAPDCWLITTDRSITGYPNNKGSGDEFVSPPIMVDQYFEDYIKRVCKVLRDCQVLVNKSCALHVHVSREKMSIEEIETIFNLYKFVEPELNKMFALSRREQRTREVRGSQKLYSYCSPLANLSFADFSNPALQGSRSETDTKYYSLRLGKTTPTLEFRIHQGTTNALKIIKWVYIIESIIDFALNGEAGIHENPKDLLLEVLDHSPRSYDLSSYYNTRVKELAK